jgi:hypothetical protein
MRMLQARDAGFIGSGIQARLEMRFVRAEGAAVDDWVSCVRPCWPSVCSV